MGKGPSGGADKLAGGLGDGAEVVLSRVGNMGGIGWKGTKRWRLNSFAFWGAVCNGFRFFDDWP